MKDDPILRALEGERNKLWAEARLKGFAVGTPQRQKIAELDVQIRDRKDAAKAARTETGRNRPQ